MEPTLARDPALRTVLRRLRLRQPSDRNGGRLGPSDRRDPCPTRYFEEASSINFRRSVTYGFGVLETAFRYRLHRTGLLRRRCSKGARMTEEPVMLAFSHPSAVLSFGLAAVPDWAYHNQQPSPGGGAAFRARRRCLASVRARSRGRSDAGHWRGFRALIGDAAGWSDFDVPLEPLAVSPRYRTLVRWTRARRRDRPGCRAAGRADRLCLLRVSPIAPFVVTSYLLGL